MERSIQIQPLEPLMIRDGRPFGATPGARAHSLNTVTPGVIAGTLRTLMRQQCSQYSTLAKVDVRGPIYMLENRLFYPMPHDLDLYEPETDDETGEDKKGSISVHVRRPCEPPKEQEQVKQGFLGTGNTGLHEDKLWPIRMPENIKKNLKSAPAYVSEEWMIRWLCDEVSPQEWSDAIGQWRNQQTEKKKKTSSSEHFIAPFAREVRTHTAIQPNTYTAMDKALFSTESLVLPPDLSLVAHVKIPEELNWTGKIKGLHSLGGKRRLAHFQEIEDSQKQSDIWTCPEKVLQAVAAHPKYVRMVLTTPAYFSKGWLPGWLNEELESTKKLDHKLPIKLKLRWACVPRWQAVSGWSYGKNKAKAVRRMAPAGSVYFFEVIEGDPIELVRSKWLASMSDEDRRHAFFDKQDGYGLATWGIWNPPNSMRGMENGN
ncbi:MULTISPECIES: type III-B CRISPR module-associated protein Cmr3 [Paenibacillus]|uniref:type III-B CRISPR module-associated protein Cmr3 n=1 Tax=Paenibacillus TaxID=44249 RepID=UPI0002FE2081|nr:MULTISPECIES: type III-B CRISPR module-associated protein Cmr3 [Paenibacillus]KAE8559298.1 type III-B CRISPR module-associated protein Cmr3 [Paenibacillus polymyxa]KKD53044.1 hypothetical protein C400_21170 [Paenibacillus sp. ICGEB2008]MBE3646510.1 type III-B CRISPR module-associated protein Cmr3 [Paenibacillus polymyxa]MCJ1220341.1 type III-B CRISPR module-associated protein Cmr3 [Paenibacillus polymyxa]MDU8672198.1 type III-B CRISPR module-associated protein Cmr3 [Paenibacillus polymyxa]